MGFFKEKRQEEEERKERIQIRMSFSGISAGEYPAKQAFDPQLIAGNIEAVAAAASGTLSCARKVGQSSWHERINI